MTTTKHDLKKEMPELTLPLALELMKATMSRPTLTEADTLRLTEYHPHFIRFLCSQVANITAKLPFWGAFARMELLWSQSSESSVVIRPDAARQGCTGVFYSYCYSNGCHSICPPIN